MRTSAVLCTLLLLAAARLPAQSLPVDSLFDHLIGHWVLRGTIARQSTTHDVTFDWLLGRNYVQMHEVSRARAPQDARRPQAWVAAQRPEAAPPEVPAAARACRHKRPQRRSREHRGSTSAEWRVSCGYPTVLESPVSYTGR